MNPLLLQSANGTAFFVGIGLAVCGLVFREWAERRILRSALTIAAVLGAAFAAMSATPQPIWAYAIWFVLFMAVLLCPATPGGKPFLTNRRFSTIRRATLAMLIVASVGLCAAELPYHLAPAIAASSERPVYVIGDSLSAGLTESERTWPKMLGDLSGLKVINLARPGATLKSGLDEARRVTDGGALVIVELGGNDLLANTDSRTFKRQLDGLLGAVRRSNVRVAMFELPLPPLYNAFGAAQRTLAAKHGVTLIPKRYLTAALGCKGGTIDGLHLSEHGHRTLAEAISGILERE